MARKVSRAVGQVFDRAARSRNWGSIQRSIPLGYVATAFPRLHERKENTTGAWKLVDKRGDVDIGFSPSTRLNARAGCLYTMTRERAQERRTMCIRLAHSTRRIRFARSMTLIQDYPPSLIILPLLLPPPAVPASTPPGIVVFCRSFVPRERTESPVPRRDNKLSSAAHFLSRNRKYRRTIAAISRKNHCGLRGDTLLSVIFRTPTTPRIRSSRCVAVCFFGEKGLINGDQQR